MKKPGRLLKIVTVLIAVFIGSVFIDSWFLEPNRIEHVCVEIQTGTPTTGKVLPGAIRGTAQIQGRGKPGTCDRGGSRRDST